MKALLALALCLGAVAILAHGGEEEREDERRGVCPHSQRTDAGVRCPQPRDPNITCRLLPGTDECTSWTEPR